MPDLCIYHNDHDGRACAAIARKKIGKELVLHPINYSSLTPWSLITNAQMVYVLDFSFSQEDMLRIAENQELIWIDHHVSAVKKLQGVAKDWQGIQDIDRAACELTWEYFFPDKPIPKAVNYIADRDLWKFALEDTGSFSEGLHQQDSNPHNDDIWIPLLNDDVHLIEDLIDEGSVIRRSRIRNIKSRVSNFAFNVRFEKWNTLVINLRGNGDIGEYIRDMGYQIAYCYIDRFVNGELITEVSLYSDRIDVSQIAQKFGGGGHQGAAGFHFKRRGNPFPPDSDVKWPDGSSID